MPALFPLDHWVVTNLYFWAEDEMQIPRSRSSIIFFTIMNKHCNVDESITNMISYLNFLLKSPNFIGKMFINWEKPRLGFQIFAKFFQKPFNSKFSAVKGTSRDDTTFHISITKSITVLVWVFCFLYQKRKINNSQE